MCVLYMESCVLFTFCKCVDQTTALAYQESCIFMYVKRDDLRY